MKVPADGFVVCNPDDKNISEVIKNINAKVINYHDFFDENLKLKIPGIHNKKDASCAIAVAKIIGIEETDSKMAVGEFSGTWRRFEYRGELKNGVKVYDDYAHHPTEISSTLEGFRELYPKENGWNLIVIFQPHLFSRTKLLLNDFAKSFVLADLVFLLPIYYAREEDDGTISSEILSNEINKFQNNNNSQAFDSFEAVEEKFKNITLTNKNIIITMGAGEAFKIADNLIHKDQI